MSMDNLVVQQPIFNQNNSNIVLTSLSTSTMNPDWKMIELSQVVKEFISGGTPSTKQAELWDGFIPWTTSATISENDITLSKAQRFITEQGLQESASHLVPKGSLLVGTRVGVGKAVVNLIDIAISQDLTGVVLDTKQVQREFVAYQFKTKRVQHILDGCKRGTTIKGISRFDLQSLKLYLPPLPEQRAIAHALQMIQNAIQARRSEIELERECKAALMQRLFMHGIRNEPTKQTEIGEIPESWEVVSLGEIIASGPKNGIYKHQSFYGQGVSIIRIDDFDNDGEIVTGGSHKVILSSTELEEFRLSQNDILINRVNSVSHLGKVALVGILTGEIVFESNMMRLTVNTDLVEPEYVFRCLVSPSARSQIKEKARRAVAQSSINQGDVKSILFPLPSLIEQRQITAILSACDSTISILEKELSLHEELFRALLDELMTGRLSALPLVE